MTVPGLCEICEAESIAPGDEMMSVECRAWVDSRTMVIHDPVERVLSHHQHICFLSNMDRTMCRCTERFEGGPALHRRHMAEEIYKALGMSGPVPWTPLVEEDA